MKYKVGDRVRIKSREWYDKCKDERGNVSMYLYNLTPEMAEYCGKEATIMSVCENYLGYRLDIDNRLHWWIDGMIEEERTKTNEMKHIVGDKVMIKSLEWYEKNKDEDGCVNVCSFSFDKLMAEYCGKEATIVEADGISDIYRIDIDDQYWLWSDGMFENTTETENTEPTSFRKLTDELADILEKKNHDYGNSFADLFQRYGMVYPIIHLAEKLGRIETLANQPNRVNGESLKDSLKDLAGYCILTLKELEN